MKNNIVKNWILLLMTCGILSPAYTQVKQQLSAQEQTFYNSLNEFCHYLKANPDIVKNRETIIKNWVSFDYVLKDTSQSRKNKRTEQLDELLVGFRHFIDSVGLENLDAAPIRYFKDSKEFFRPFKESLSAQAPLTFAYYDKRRPLQPIGCLLFDDRTGKLVSWIILNQGGHYYFLTFNLM